MKKYLFSIIVLLLSFAFSGTVAHAQIAVPTQIPVDREMVETCFNTFDTTIGNGMDRATVGNAARALVPCLTNAHVTTDESKTNNAILCVAGLGLPVRTSNVRSCISQAGINVAGSIQFAKPAGALESIQQILSGAISLILIVAGLIAFVYLLLGGIKWITSGGDSAAVETARGQIIQALIGLIVVFAAWGIIVLFERATGIGLGFTSPVSFPKFYVTPTQ